MTIFNEPAKFDGIAFPVLSYSIAGGIRDHVHEYPHSPGGAVEKLGRKLYTFRLSTIFDQRLAGYGDNQFPGDLSDLRDRWEDQVTSALYIPTIGEIQAYCVTWTENATPEQQSGVKVELEFREDQSQAFLVNALVQVSATTLQSAGTRFDEQIAPFMSGATLANTGIIVDPPTGTRPTAQTLQQAYSQLRQKDVTILGSISEGYQKVLAWSEQPDKYADLILRTTNDLAAKCQRARDIFMFRNPLAWQSFRALCDLQARIVDLRKTLAEKNRILTATTTIDTSVLTLSRVIYGDTSRAAQVMQLNGFNDPMRIPKSTEYRYYDPATQQRAA